MKLTADYIRGLVDGEGSFTFSRRPGIVTDERRVYAHPAFVLRMHARDKSLIEAVRDYWHLKEKVYEYQHGGRHYAMLIVRDFADLKNIIVPFFYKNLQGHKGKQFTEWLERLGGESVAPNYRLIYRLYKTGFYDKPANILYKWE